MAYIEESPGSSLIFDSECVRSKKSPAPFLDSRNDYYYGEENNSSNNNNSKMFTNKTKFLSYHNKQTMAKHCRPRSWTTNQMPIQQRSTTNNKNNSLSQTNNTSTTSNYKHHRRSTIHNFMVSPRLPTLPEHNGLNIYSIDCLRHFEPFNNDTDLLNYAVPLDELDPDDLYSTFRSRVPLKRLFTDENQCWLYYDSGLPIKYVDRFGSTETKVKAKSCIQPVEDTSVDLSDVNQTQTHLEDQASTTVIKADNLSSTPRETNVIQEFKLTKTCDSKNISKVESHNSEPANFRYLETKRDFEQSENPPKLDLPVLLFLPGAIETADVFYKQILELSKSYRCISVFWPDFWTIENFNFGFRSFLDSLDLTKVHLFGSNLGGFLAQKFASSLHGRNRVLSIILYSTWIDSSVFKKNSAASFYWMMPKLALITTFLPSYSQDLQSQQSLAFIKNSNTNTQAGTSKKSNSTASRDELRATSFVSDRFKGMSQSELASRLTLNHVSDYVNSTHMPTDIFMTIIELFDRYDLNNSIHLGLHKLYPDAKVALLKCGGDYPYLARAADVNIYITTHMNHYYRKD